MESLWFEVLDSAMLCASLGRPPRGASRFTALVMAKDENEAL